MKALFTNLYTYQRHFNLKTLELFEAYGSTTPERCLYLFSHMLNAHHIWNTRILEQASAVGVFEVHGLVRMRELIESNHQNSLRIIENEDFNRRFDYVNAQGDAFSNLIEEIMFHVVNHTTYHRGQIMADLRQAGLEPVSTDYSTYTRE